MDEGREEATKVDRDKGLAQSSTYRYPDGGVVKNHLPMQETHEIRVPSLGQEDSSGVGNGNPLQYSCQENPMDRGAWSIVMGSQRAGLD